MDVPANVQGGRRERNHTSLLNRSWLFGVLRASDSLCENEFDSIVIVDDIFAPWTSDPTCLHAIFTILLPCVVSR